MAEASGSERAPQTLVQQVMQHIHRRIASRQLVPGARIPSIRQSAESLKVSKSTVVEAYDRLAAEGIISARRGSGFYVAGQLPPLNLSEIGPRLDRAIDPLWVSRQSLEAGDPFEKPGCGWLPASWMPEAAIRRSMRAIARADQSLLTEYGTPLGLPELRQVLRRRMAEQGIEAGIDQIILMESGTQAIDLLCRFLLDPGDTVLVDDPCYFNFRALLKAHQVSVVSVPYTPNGPDPAQFAQILLDDKPRLYITNSGAHNPTGASLSPKVAHRILKLAEQSDLIIIEDDIFGGFDGEPTPRLAAFDGLDRVIHVSSFSKSISAAIRCGFIAARPEWIEGLTDLKIATTFGGGPFSAELTLRVLKDGAYRRHIDELQKRLSTARGETAARLRKIGIEPWIMPQSGMYLWCALPGGIEAADIAQQALEQHIILAPGNVFSHSGKAGNYLRFNVAQCTAPRIFTTLEALLET